GWSSLGEVIDANGMILGRLASYAAEQVKGGEDVDIVNAEQAVVSGTAEEVFDRYRQRRETGSKESGPTYPKAPERIVARAVRGMLPDGSDGREAFKRLTAYRGNPEDRETDDIDVKTADDLRGREYVTVQEISDNI
ncbi:MAG: 50S ribosomal protein L13, partial [Candidatus Nanohaloarchaea archaeon]|nr:50S ribosomal protein L13 [Candidatus Nanohaloarchaea archaeon]